LGTSFSQIDEDTFSDIAPTMGTTTGTTTGQGVSTGDSADESEDEGEDTTEADISLGVPGLSISEADLAGLIGLDKGEALSAHFSRAKEGKKSGVPLGPIGKENSQSLVNMVNLGLITNQEALDIAKGDISDGGLGGQSPGGFAANNSTTEGLTMGQIAAINAIDPATGEYAGNLPAPAIGTPAFDLAINASIANAAAFPGAAAVIGGLAGLVPGGSLMTAASLLSGQPSGLAGLFSEAVPGFSQGFTTAGQAISDALGGVSNALDAGFGAIGFGPDGTSPDGGGFDGGFDGGGVDGGGPPPLPTVPETPPTPATPTVPETLDEVDLTLLPAVAQNLPPARRPTTPFSTFGQPTLPPVFTEQDARALLQQTGQLPLAGIA